MRMTFVQNAGFGPRAKTRRPLLHGGGSKLHQTSILELGKESVSARTWAWSRCTRLPPRSSTDMTWNWSTRRASGWWMADGCSDREVSLSFSARERHSFERWQQPNAFLLND